MHFNTLYLTVPSVSEKVLAQVLKQHTADGIIGRQLFADVPPRVKYSITDFGRTLIPHVKALDELGTGEF